MPQARHVSRPLSFGDRIMVGAGAGSALDGRQREADLIDTTHQGAVRPQPGVGEHLHHERVLAQRLRDEGADPSAAGL